MGKSWNSVNGVTDEFHSKSNEILFTRKLLQSLFVYIYFHFDWFFLVFRSWGEKKLWTSTCWFSNNVISKIFEIFFIAEFISHRFIIFSLTKDAQNINFFIFQTILWILMVFKNYWDLLLYRPVLQQETQKCLGLLLYTHFFSFAHLAVTYTLHSVPTLYIALFLWAADQ